ncbi:DEAD-box ATP-dependent RNA helicase 14 [Rhynchospora pubera]|uniref:RNA helicase n=1 Tax=Rhynchospora pubera TaxID=906938 RepID=A0AAV8CX46_9POAL|nr:DEAD-box ATP-dependent RNA helicase 14 [Rhynchospora pubera]
MAKEGGNVRYAPADPTLAAPWKGLIDGATGNIYFWNLLTSVTQYHRPSPNPNPNPSDQIEATTEAPPQPQPPNASPPASTPPPSPGTPSSPTPHPHPQPSQTPTPTPAPAPAPTIISPQGGEAYRRQHEIAVQGNNVPLPFTTFESTCFPPGLIRELYRAGFKEPTAIQAQSWPIAMQGKDIVAVAKTGSGKTLGFLIPGFIILKRLCNDPRRGPTVLVLSPTRELATQIQDQALKFGGPAKITTTCLYGGAAKGPQLKDLERGVDVVVATPGRLNDILEMGRLSLQQVVYLVLDEADRMLDMGFEPQIRKIAAHLPAHRQTLMFTATWPAAVRNIASALLRNNPVQVRIGNTDSLVANKSITQHVEVINPMEKRRRLDQILRSQDANAKTIIFCSTKKMCDMLAQNLQQRYGASAIHGDKSQPERDSVLASFRAGRCHVLVATDVAARGLDIKDIKVVVNYDFPTGVEDYVHRIGRTGRAGATGTAFTFFCDQDGKYASDLVKVLEGAGQKVPPELRDMVGRGGFGARPCRWGGSNGSSSGGSASNWGKTAGGSGSTWGGSGSGGSNGGGNCGWGGSGRGGSNGNSGSRGGRSSGSGGGWGGSGRGGSNGNIGGGGGRSSGSGGGWGGSSGSGGNSGGVWGGSSGSGGGWGGCGSGNGSNMSFHDRFSSEANEQSGARSRSRSPDKSYF